MFRDGDTKLIDYLPLYLRDYVELNKIFDAEEPELAQLWAKVKKSIDNQYIMTTDEEGIERYEKLLDIEPTGDLEARQVAVYVRWADMPPYTVENLRARLEPLTDDGNVKVTEDYNAYTVTIELSLRNRLMYDLVKSTIADIMPANIDWSIKQGSIIDDTIYLGGVVATSHYHIIGTKEG